MSLAMAPPVRRSASRWLGWVGLALAGLGYWGPWIWHPSAALTLIGLDLGEFVKFLPSVRSGQLTLHREIFFLPAAALSLNLTLIAYRRGSRLKWRGKIIASLGAIAIALAMLPPAWSLATLRLPEFRTLTILIALCVVFALAGPIWRGLPRCWLGGVALFSAALAAVGPLWQFWLVLPAIQTAYGRPLAIGWGPVTMAFGWLLFAASEGLQMTQHGREGNSTGYVKHSD